MSRTRPAFLRKMRLAQTETELFSICDRYLLTDPDQEFALEPYPGLVARPKCETAYEPMVLSRLGQVQSVQG
jgi:hypothetical protein